MMRKKLALKLRRLVWRLDPPSSGLWISDEFQQGTWRSGGQTVLEFESDGVSTGSVLKINGQPVYDCLGLTVDVQPGGFVITTVQFEGAPLRFNATLFDGEREYCERTT